jgi:hypothetical protein
MPYKYFSQPTMAVNLNPSAAVCFYADPTKEETVRVELVDGSKFKLETVLYEIEEWLN